MESPNPLLRIPQESSSSSFVRLLSSAIRSPRKRTKSRLSTTAPAEVQAVEIMSPPEVMSLQEFEHWYSNKLPLIIRTTTGYCGLNREISPMETLYVHFKKTTEVVIAESCGGENILCTIPRNSNIQFCIIYNPKENMSNAMQGYCFRDVKELVSAKPRPKVVRSIKVWSNGVTTLDRNELLVLKGLKDNDDLEVFSVTTNTSMSLPFSCSCGFTTEPRLLAMYLTDMRHVPELFPCRVLVQNNEEITQSIGAKYIYLQKEKSETVLQCSFPGSKDIFDLPVDLPGLKVTVVQSESETEQKGLEDSTTEMVINFNPAYGAVCRDGVGSAIYEAQSMLNKFIRVGHEMDGVSITYNGDLVKKENEMSTERIYATADENHLYATLDADEGKKRRNTTYLASLSGQQIQVLLYNMGLEVYQKTFTEENINGAIMCELDADILQTELNIQNELHRNRLMCVIRGEMDARIFMEE